MKNLVGKLTKSLIVTTLLVLVANIAHARPDKYEVKPGDSLIGVAAKFVADESLWPTLWDKNIHSGRDKEGDSAFKLYPGDVVVYKEFDGEPKLIVSRGGEVNLSPSVVVSSLTEAIPTIPLDVIKPFLVQTRYLTREEIDKAPKIAETFEGNLGVMPGDGFYVTGINSKKFTGYNIYSEGNTLVHPETKEALGIEAIVKGRARLDIFGAKSGRSHMVIEKANEEIEPGYLLMPLETGSLKPYYVPRAPEGFPHGFIVGMVGENTEISQYHIVTLSGGLDQGRKEGDILDVYRTSLKEGDVEEGQTPFLPSQRMGRLMVFRVFDKLSLGLVLSAKAELALNDEVAKP